MKKILIISAHPDDDILGCGGIISKYSKKAQIKVIFICEGTSCRFEVKQTKEIIIKEKIDQRNRFAKDALEFLGVKKYKFYNFPCGQLDKIPLIEINKIIETEILSFKPDTIFSHSKNDVNNDHQIVYKSTLIATRPGSKFFVKRLFSYEVLSSSEWNFEKVFKPNYFISLSRENLDKKIEAMNIYKTEVNQFPYPRSAEGIEVLAKFRGIQSKNNFAEAFKVIRILS